MTDQGTAKIGVIIVSYQSAEIIGPCLESLLASRGVALRVAVCDNASADDSAARVRDFAKARGIDLFEAGAGSPEMAAGRPGPLALLHTGGNLGYAGAVNIGLGYLARDPGIGLFWVLNPDSIVDPEAARAYVDCAGAGRFALMGGRTIYHEPPRLIQSDGGRVGRWSGMCRNVNQGLEPARAECPDPAGLDFISGANMVASRAFLDQAGPMEEGYFLYYEEVDWAARRGDLPLVICPGAVVYHHGGTAIGSGSHARRASEFANYFNYRNRLRFVARFRPAALPFAWGYSMLKIVKLLLQGGWNEARGAFLGMHGLPPPAAVRSRLSPEAWARAFGKGRKR